MKPNRRNFIKNVTAASALLATESIARPFNIIKDLKKISPNDKIRFATIGMGIQGHSDTKAALRSSQDVEFVAAADLYDGRLEDAKRKWGKDLITTKHYKEILDRKDVDAVIIGTPDHWHKQISVDAMAAGKHVYCEKPMVHGVDEGPAVIAAQKKYGKVFMVGSQGLSSLGNEKARELLKDGAAQLLERLRQEAT